MCKHKGANSTRKKDDVMDLKPGVAQDSDKNQTKLSLIQYIKFMMAKSLHLRVKFLIFVQQG